MATSNGEEKKSPQISNFHFCIAIAYKRFLDYFHKFDIIFIGMKVSSLKVFSMKVSSK